MNIIELKEVFKKFPEITAVDGVSLTIRQGEVYGLLGPNGAGKSTTISMIASLLSPTAGEITVKGFSVSKNANQIKKLIGLVPQDIALYPTLTARENLEFWGKMYGLNGEKLKRRIGEVLEIVGLTSREKNRVETYSGGMKRRINIAVGLLNQPELLIMDEPTVGVDPQSRNHILETVKGLNANGMTVLYTSHYMEEVEFLCDRIGIMDHGKLIAEGTKDELTLLVGDYHTIKIQAKGLNEDLLKALGQIPGVQSVKFVAENLEVLAPRGEGENILPEIIRTLVIKSAKVESVQIQDPDLESVFLHLTGRALRD